MTEETTSAYVEENHTSDCRIHDDGSCCDCGYVAQFEIEKTMITPAFSLDFTTIG